MNTVLDKICTSKFEQKVHLTFQRKSKTNKVEMIYPPSDISSTVPYRWCSHLANVSEVAPVVSMSSMSLPVAVHELINVLAR